MNCKSRRTCKKKKKTELIPRYQGKNYPKGPEAKDDDDEINGVSEEHKDVNIRDSIVLWLNESSEELTYRIIERHTPRIKKNKRFFVFVILMTHY